VKITVDRERCVGSGQCLLRMPDVFTQDDDEGLVVLLEQHGADTTLPPSLKSRMRARLRRLPSMTSHEMKHIVVVGAGGAGLSALERFRRSGHTGAVSIIGAEAQYPYDRAPLSKQALTGTWTGEQVCLRPRHALEALGVTSPAATTSTAARSCASQTTTSFAAIYQAGDEGVAGITWNLPKQGSNVRRYVLDGCAARLGATT